MTITDTKRRQLVLDPEILCQRVAQLEVENARLRKEIDDLTRAEEQLRTVVDNAHDVVFQLTPTGVIQYISPGVREICGYEPDALIGKHFESTTPPSELPRATEALRRALSGEKIFNLEISQLNSSGSIVTVEINGAPIKKDDKVIAVQGVMRDVTERKRAEEVARNSAQKLIKAMENTIQAMAMIVEMRDPYTAGHQRRVTQLACAIAKKMGLSKDRTTGLRLAGLIHDIGKVRVPTEILTHPDGLSEAEFDMIKVHPLVGYEILKTMESPWPIADIVYQHHERMDGSGYPSGLRGNKITLEARILAVADVVEAIASHRPYRPARGLDKALEEISQKKGILYDPKLVDTCLKLFRDHEFKFE